jgi:hypothetical protein
MKDYKSIVVSNVTLDELVERYNSELNAYNKRVKLKIMRLKPITKEQIRLDNVTIITSLTNNMISGDNYIFDKLMVCSIFAVIKDNDKYSARIIFFKDYHNNMKTKDILQSLNGILGSDNNNKRYLDFSICRLLRVGNTPRDIAKYIIYHSELYKMEFWCKKLFDIDDMFRKMNVKTEIDTSNSMLEIRFDFGAIYIEFENIFSSRFTIYGKFNNFQAYIEVTDESQVTPAIYNIICEYISRIFKVEQVDSGELLKYMALKSKLEDVIYGKAMAKAE